MTRMTCREFIEFLWQYESNELSPEERARFDDHLTRCAPCVRYLQSYRATIKISKVALAPTDEPVPMDVPEELLQAILSSREKQA
ncbi:MAG TPA: zf-HC2 domain-containing protein [Methylomirabilota bacterium]|jgi:anti-sigma factor RsiW|nr:zf-HC2 domain-containing protein [Methylomirabilota bacterium]